MPPPPDRLTCGDAAFATDADGVILTWNDAAARLCGRSSADAIGRPCHDVIRGTDRFGNRYCDSQCPVLRMARRGEPVREFTIDVVDPTGRPFPLHVSLLALWESGAAAPMIVHVLRQAPVGERCEPARVGLGAKDARAGGESREVEAALLAGLSGREREVLRHLSEGASSEHIADRLFISVATVRRHIQSILTKLGVHSRLEAVCMAARAAAPKNSKDVPAP